MKISRYDMTFSASLLCTRRFMIFQIKLTFIGIQEHTQHFRFIHKFVLVELAYDECDSVELCPYHSECYAINTHMYVLIAF